MTSWLSYSGSPEGLSFFKMSVPFVVVGVVKVSVVLKGTKLVVIQSVCA